MFAAVNGVGDVVWALLLGRDHCVAHKAPAVHSVPLRKLRREMSCVWNKYFMGNLVLIQWRIHQIYPFKLWRQNLIDNQGNQVCAGAYTKQN